VCVHVYEPWGQNPSSVFAVYDTNARVRCSVIIGDGPVFVPEDRSNTTIPDNDICLISA